MSRHTWGIREVSDTGGPAAALRNYLEQRDVRRCLRQAASQRPIHAACDVGCGYGRLTAVLGEFAARVTGFEREGDLLAQARRLLPDTEWVFVDALDALPAEPASFDFAMTFTVLQHLNDHVARRTAEELKRIAQGGFVLLVEETDPTIGEVFAPDSMEGMTRGRSMPVYRSWMKPFELCLSFRREIEPGYVRSDVGSYMLFDGRAPGQDS